MNAQAYRHPLSEILCNNRSHATPVLSSNPASQHLPAGIPLNVPTTPPPPYNDSWTTQEENATPQVEIGEEEEATLHIDATTVVKGHGNIINIESLRAMIVKLASEFACSSGQLQSAADTRPAPTASPSPPDNSAVVVASDEDIANEGNRAHQAAVGTVHMAQQIGGRRALKVKIDCGLRIFGDRNLVGCIVRPTLVARVKPESQRAASRQGDSTAESGQRCTYQGPVTRSLKRKAEKDVRGSQSDNRCKKVKSNKS